MAGIDTVKALLSLLNDSSSSTTTSTNVSKEGINALLQQILSGTQGLAAVSSGQKASGLYNSTTNQMLINDLLTRASGEAAKLQSSTTENKVVKAPLGGNTGKTIQTAMLLKSLTGSVEDLINSFDAGSAVNLTGTAAGSATLDSLAAGAAAGGVSDYAGAAAQTLRSSLDILSNLGASIAEDAALSATTDVATDIATDVGTEVVTDAAEEGIYDWFTSLFG